MRKHLLIALLVLLASGAIAQIRIPGTHTQFTLPENDWKYLQTTKVDRNTNVYLYAYCGSLVTSAEGDTVLPYIRVYVRRNYSASALDLAADRWSQQPFQSIDETPFSVRNSEGIAYLGAYTNPRDGKDYLFRMAYFKDNNVAIEFRAETSRDTYDAFDTTFQTILNSIQTEK